MLKSILFLLSLATFVHALGPLVYGSDSLWVDDKNSDSYNCDGIVVDAICCSHNLCANRPNQESCTKGGKRAFLCRWDKQRQNCTEFRDVENNVCCQNEPKKMACNDVLNGKCPLDFQVPEGCCNDVRNDTLEVAKSGHVCCNSPCSDMRANQCQLPAYCGPNQRSFGNQIGQNYGFNYNYGNYNYGQVIPFQYGGQYATAGEGVDNYDSYDNLRKKEEVTLDDMMDMMITALQEDKNVVSYDSTRTSNPWTGKSQYYNSSPFSANYLNPDALIQKAFSPYGFGGFYGYGNNNYGNGYGGNNYGNGYGNNNYGNGYGNNNYGGGYGNNNNYGGGYGNGNNNNYGGGYGNNMNYGNANNNNYGSDYGNTNNYGSGYGNSNNYGSVPNSGYGGGSTSGGGYNTGSTYSQ